MKWKRTAAVLLLGGLLLAGCGAPEAEPAPTEDRELIRTEAATNRPAAGPEPPSEMETEPETRTDPTVATEAVTEATAPTEAETATAAAGQVTMALERDAFWEVPESLEVVISNNMEQDIVIDLQEAIDYWNGSEWEPFPYDAPVEESEAIVRAGETHTHTLYLLPGAHEYPLGRYRLRKSGPTELTAEFSITASATMSLGRNTFEEPPDHLAIVVVNNTQEEITTDLQHELEYWNGIAWGDFPLNVETSGAAVYIAPGGTCAYTMYLFPEEHEYRPGRYRVRKTRPNEMTAEFTIGDAPAAAVRMTLAQDSFDRAPDALDVTVANHSHEVYAADMYFVLERHGEKGWEALTPDAPFDAVPVEIAPGQTQQLRVPLLPGEYDYQPGQYRVRCTDPTELTAAFTVGGEDE